MIRLNILLFLIITYSISADTVHIRDLTIDNIVTIGLSKNDLIRSKQRLLEAQKYETKQAGYWDNPTATVNIGLKKQPDISALKGLIYNAQVSQNIPVHGKIQLKREYSDTKYKILEDDYKKTKITIYYDLIYLSYLYLEAKEHLYYLDERKKYYDKAKIYLGNRPFVSPQKIAEKELISTKITILDKELLKLEANAAIIGERLNRYLELDEVINIIAPWFIEGVELDYDNLRQEMLLYHTLLVTNQYNIQQNLIETKAAKLDVYSGLSLSGYYSQENGYAQEHWFSGGLTFPIPVVNQNTNKIKSLEQQKDSLYYQGLNFEKKILSDFESLRIQYEKSKSLLPLFSTEQLEERKSKMKYIDKEFSKGLIDILTYIEADNQFFSYHESFFEIQLEYIKAYIDLLQISNKMKFKMENGEYIRE